MRFFLGLLLLATLVSAGEPRVHRNIPYAEPRNERQLLDVYAPKEEGSHPVVVWLHGGGWRAGDKTQVHRKPQAFAERGFVFVAVNYRFVPQVGVEEMARDVARALRWVQDHAAEFGGDPQTLFVAGHSAGAHLAALVCTDERYLQAEGLSPADLRGCVCVDTAAYDVPALIKGRGMLATGIYTGVFGHQASSQKRFSPITHIAAGKNIPPFLILDVVARKDSTLQANAFAGALREAGVEVSVVPVKGKSHATVNRDLGSENDESTEALFGFLRAKLPRERSE